LLYGLLRSTAARAKRVLATALWGVPSRLSAAVELAREGW
jgi:hypothetical protein